MTDMQRNILRVGQHSLAIQSQIASRSRSHEVLGTYGRCRHRCVVSGARKHLRWRFPHPTLYMMIGVIGDMAITYLMQGSLLR